MGARGASVLLLGALAPAAAQSGCDYSNTIGLGKEFLRTTVLGSDALAPGTASDVHVKPEYYDVSTRSWTALGDSPYLIPLRMDGPKVTLRVSDEQGVGSTNS